MSLLTDPDFLLQSLRLNFIRHVLPNHAVQSSIPGTGSYNLIAFDAASPTLASPYVVTAGLADETAWPELASGRSSPPLGLARARGTDNITASSRRRGPTPGTLQYSQTIGKGVGGAGMRVGGRAKSWKGRGAGQLDPSTAEESGDSGVDPESGGEMTVQRQRSLEASIHHRRIGVGAAQLNQALMLPPVVVHSPARTPQDSPVGGVHPGRPGTPPSAASFSDFRPSEPHPRSAGEIDLDALDETSVSETPFTAELSVATSKDPYEEDSDQFEESPLELPSEPLSLVSANAELAGAATAPTSSFRDAPSTSHSPPDGAVILPASPISSGSPSLNGDETGVSDVGGRFASVASSGISLFGVSRANGNALGRDRSDSESSLAVPHSDKRVEAIAEGAENDETDSLVSEEPPTPPPPTRLRAGRERRRVNISGRMLVPIVEPANEEDTPPTSAPPGPHPSAAVEVTARPRSNTDPEALAVPLSTQADVPTRSKQEDSPNRLRRKASAPGLLLQGPLTSAPPSATTTPQHPTVPLPTTATLAPPPSPSRQHSSHSTITFPLRSTFTDVRPPVPQRSALSALLSSKSDSPSASNPFSALYAALASRASDALKLSIYFPNSKTPTKPLKISVKKDLSVEEVIGAGLWSYWEEGREPKLEVEEDGSDHDETTKWNLRIVEDDGEVDEDFPALDRTRAISKFSFDEFAIVKASSQQVKDNQAKQATIQRRPSRVLAPPKRAAATLASPVPGLQPPLPTSAAALTEAAATLAPTSMVPMHASFRPGTVGVSSALAIPVLLKIRLPPAPGVAEINTTINVPNDMYISDVLDHVCKKRGLENPKEWALVVEHGGAEIIVPLDRTVDSLGDQRDLVLVKYRAQPRQANIRTNVNPSASIFKRLSEPPQPKYQSASDLTSAYVRYSVQRKLPMPLGRHPRIIAIDGDYIHFMPSDSKGMLSGGRTSSFHISHVQDCKVSRRSPSSFKLLVQKDRVDKRYDFEAENPKAAAEIVAHIRLLMGAYRAEQEARAGR